MTNCLFRRGFRNGLLVGVVPVRPGAPALVGPAYTLRFIPSREDIDGLEAYTRDDNLHRRAMEECPPGHVLIMSTGGEVGVASGGDIMLSRLMVRGGAGVVTDGGFRDTPDIARLNFAAYHRAAAPASSPIRMHPVELDCAIGCAGVAVYPGDIVVGDAEGVVVLPAHLADEIAAEASEMTRYEAFAAAQILKGRSLLGLYPSTEASRLEFANWVAP